MTPWPRMRVTFADGSQALFPEGPLCRQCKHHPCPCCSGWCDILDTGPDDELVQCCNGWCDYAPGEWQEWQSAFVDFLDGDSVVQTEAE